MKACLIAVCLFALSTLASAQENVWQQSWAQLCLDTQKSNDGLKALWLTAKTDSFVSPSDFGTSSSDLIDKLQSLRDFLTLLTVIVFDDDENLRTRERALKSFVTLESRWGFRDLASSTSKQMNYSALKEIKSKEVRESLMQIFQALYSESSARVNYLSFLNYGGIYRYSEEKIERLWAPSRGLSVNVVEIEAAGSENVRIAKIKNGAIIRFTVPNQLPGPIALLNKIANLSKGETVPCLVAMGGGTILSFIEPKGDNSSLGRYKIFTKGILTDRETNNLQEFAAEWGIEVSKLKGDLYAVTSSLDSSFLREVLLSSGISLETMEMSK